MNKAEKLKKIKEIYKKYNDDFSYLEKEQSEIFINFIKKLEDYQMSKLIYSMKNID